jgi:hypothetical protein|tara:strand:- start:163 stop:735 length:573 start_codon:yes stop_codon:yes gene_type:complete
MNIDKFKNAIGGGVRSSLFRVQGDIGRLGKDDRVNFLCTAAQLPASTLSETTAPFRGRLLKIPTARTFDAWTITILSDRGMELRSKFEQWMDSINGARDNVEQIDGAVTNFESSFLTNWRVQQLDRSGKPVKSYELYYCYPTSVSAVDLDSGDADSLSSFTATLSYSYFLTSAVSTGGNPRGNFQIGETD